MAASPEIFRAQPLENGDSSLPVVQRRVLPIYRLTTQFMKPDCEMLDIGTYDGFGVVERGFDMKNALLEMTLGSLPEGALLSSLIETFSTLLDDTFFSHR